MELNRIITSIGRLLQSAVGATNRIETALADRLALALADPSQKPRRLGATMRREDGTTLTEPKDIMGRATRLRTAPPRHPPVPISPWVFLATG
jgi:hypothetical protein